MSESSSAVLNRKVQANRSRAVAAIEKKDYFKAKELFQEAARDLLTLAESSEGATRSSYIEQGRNVLSKIEKLNEIIAKKYPEKVNASSSDNKGSDNANKFNSVQSGNSSKNSDGNTDEKIDKVTFDDVAGLDDVKNEINLKVIWPMKNAELYKKFKKTPNGGILLYGEPGTGKTMIAKAIANEVDAEFFPISCSDILSKWVGDSEKNVKELFDKARKAKRAIIFFDEFDSIGASRSEDSSSSAGNRLVAELLTQLQGVKAHPDSFILVIAATNRPWAIDSGLARSGRLGTKIHVGLPDDKARLAIISHQLDGVPMESDVDFGKINEKTVGFSGADVVGFCDKLKDLAILDSMRLGNEVKISLDHLNTASNTFRSSVLASDVEAIRRYEQSSQS